MIWINGKLYTFYDHFESRIKERSIKIEWVERTLETPDDIGFSRITGRTLYDRFIEELGHEIRVVVDEEEAMIVTAHHL